MGGHENAERLRALRQSLHEECKRGGAAWLLSRVGGFVDCKTKMGLVERVRGMFRMRLSFRVMIQQIVA